MIDLDSLNLYEILDVDPRATVEEIKRAYQIAQKTYSTEHMATYGLFSESERGKILQRVQGAYTVLIDPDRRREYDEELQRRGMYPATQAGEIIAPSYSQPPLPQFLPEEEELQAGADDRQELDRLVKEILESAEESGHWSGKVLREIRELRGLSLETIAHRTKISRGHLRYIEDDSFDYLPPDVYVKGFIMQISKVLGLDPDHTTSRLMEHIRKTRGVR
jgi:curved DNA-binding protein CbpA